MVKSINVDEKKRGRGRPRTGMHPVLSGRVPKEIVAAVDDWSAANGYTRSEGVAALLKRGLEAIRVDAVVAANRAAKPKKR